MNLFIISGGQTGVDRAALDVALKLNMPCGGWCPGGRWAEDGPLNERYPLSETTSVFPDDRTERNISESDGTLILTRHGRLDPGTKTALHLISSLKKNHLEIDLEQEDDKNLECVSGWLKTHRISRLNIAGARESNDPGIYENACHFLTRLFEHV